MPFLIPRATSSGGGGASREGSVFSTVAPTGASAPTAVYDFTNGDMSLSAAARLVAANKMGDAALDLTAVGDAQIYPLDLGAGAAAGRSPYALSPVSVGQRGTALVSGGGTNYVVTSGAPAGVRGIAALTAEWFGYVTTPPTSGDMYIYYVAGSGEDDPTNTTSSLVWRATGSWSYLHENGPAGDNAEAAMFLSTTAEMSAMKSLPTQLLFTRAAGTGYLNMYVNGRRVTDGNIAAVPTALPTGGSAANLALGVGSEVGTRMATLGFRMWSGAVLTDAQIRESYTRSLFGLKI